MALPAGSSNFPLGLGTVQIEDLSFVPISVDIPTESFRLIQRTDEVGNPSDYQIRVASEKITGSMVVQTKAEPIPSYSSGSLNTDRLKTKHNGFFPRSGQNLMYEGGLAGDGVLFCTITDVKSVKSKDDAQQYELGLLLMYYSPSYLEIDITTSGFYYGIVLNPINASVGSLPATNLSCPQDSFNFVRTETAYGRRYYYPSNDNWFYHIRGNVGTTVSTNQTIGKMPSDVGEIPITVMLANAPVSFYGGSYKQELDISQCSSHIQSVKETSIINTGNSYFDTVVKQHEIVVDTDQSGDVSLYFDVSLVT